MSDACLAATGPSGTLTWVTLAAVALVVGAAAVALTRRGRTPKGAAAILLAATLALTGAGVGLVGAGQAVAAGAECEPGGGTPAQPAPSSGAPSSSESAPSEGATGEPASSAPSSTPATDEAPESSATPPATSEAPTPTGTAEPTGTADPSGTSQPSNTSQAPSETAETTQTSPEPSETTAQPTSTGPSATPTEPTESTQQCEAAPPPELANYVWNDREDSVGDNTVWKLPEDSRAALDDYLRANAARTLAVSAKDARTGIYLEYGARASVQDETASGGSREIRSGIHSVQARFASPDPTVTLVGLDLEVPAADLLATPPPGRTEAWTEELRNRAVQQLLNDPRVDLQVGISEGAGGGGGGVSGTFLWTITDECGTQHERTSDYTFSDAGGGSGPPGNGNENPPIVLDSPETEMNDGSLPPPPVAPTTPAPTTQAPTSSGSASTSTSAAPTTSVAVTSSSSAAARAGAEPSDPSPLLVAAARALPAWFAY